MSEPQVLLLIALVGWIGTLVVGGFYGGRFVGRLAIAMENFTVVIADLKDAFKEHSSKIDQIAATQAGHETAITVLEAWQKTHPSNCPYPLGQPALHPALRRNT